PKRGVIVENSPMLTSRGLGRVLGDLAAMGFDARWGVLGAHHAGAPHERERIWILAHRKGERRRAGWQGRFDTGNTRQREQALQDASHANSLQYEGASHAWRGQGEEARSAFLRRAWPAEPGL